ncbi:autotransporter outer membrane beta-barrel domain-containing protein [Ancylobacter sp. VNQ12]|uniref:autotransporter outer membrane beta-barrel domain-containing protein n=1 Tax=Ancylobacter sp. VNQ12 TaxID=3400920 RepID=UPI003C015F75
MDIRISFPRGMRFGLSVRARSLLRTSALSGLAGLALLAPPGSVQAQESATIPLHTGAATNGFSNQIAVAVGGGSTLTVLMDTGSTGLYVYESQIGPASTVITSGGAPVTFQYGYSSGNELHGYFVSTLVAFPEASTALSTGWITVGAVTSLECKGGGDWCPGWPTGQSGVMGVAYSAEPAAVFNPFAQLPGNYGSGFIVVSNDLGEPGMTPHVIVGLTAQNTAGFVWSQFAADDGGTQPAGLNAWNTKSINTCFSVNNGSPGCFVTVFDTGAPLGSFETGTSGEAYGQVTPGSSVTTTVPGVISFANVAGSSNNENFYVYDPAHGTSAGYNSGAGLFRYYVVAYDGVNGRIGFAPLQNVLLGTIFAASDADLGVPGGGVLLAGQLVTSPGFSTDRAIAFGTDAGLTILGSATFAGTLSGSVDMDVAIAPGGVLALSGTNLYSGIMTVSGGALVVNGLLPATLLLDGTVLSGSGTIGAVAAATGSSLAPGNSIGTLTVLGNAVFAAGATYTAEIGASGSSDLIAVGGTAFLAGTLDIELYGPGTPVLGSHYTLLSAQGGIAGSFQSVQAADFGAAGTAFPFLEPLVSYSAGTVELTMGRSAVSFTTAARTPNQFAMARAADSATDASDAIVALAGLNETTATPALQALSGEIYASAQSVMQQQSAYLRDALSARLRQAQDEPGAPAAALGPTVVASGGLPLSFWGQGFGGWGDISSNGNAASVSNSIGGAVFGLDTPLGEGWRAGLVGGYSRSSFSQSSGWGNIDTYDIGLYAGGRIGAASLSLGAAYGWNDVTVSRSVAFSGYASGAAGDYDADGFQAFAELAYDVVLDRVTLTPFAGLAYVGLNGADFAESGTGAALDVATKDMDTLYSALGLRFSVPIAIRGHDMWLGGTLGWQHAFGDVTPTTTVAFATGSDAVALSGVPIAQDAALLGLELAYAPTDATRLAVKYAGQLADSANQNTILAQLVVKF